MNRGYLYLILTLICTLLIFFIPLWLQIIVGWIGLASLYFAIAYFSGRGEILMKSRNGRLPIYIKITLLPVLLGVTAYNLIVRSRDKAPPLQKIRDGLWLSRRLVFTDLNDFRTSGINAILDVTAEFDALEFSVLPDEVTYFNIPVMDHHTPRIEQLRKAVLWIDKQRREGKEVLIHCALGQGRSVTVMLAYLYHLDPGANVDDLVKEIQKIRTTVKPNSRQKRRLDEFIRQTPDKGYLTLIYNPAAGNKPGDDLRKIIQELEPYFSLDIIHTKKDKPLNKMVTRSIQEGATIIVACGGDGTIHEVAATLVDTDILFGIIPRGTANALATCLFGPSFRLNPIREGCRHIIDGNPVAIDTVKTDTGRMLLLAGVGMEEGMVNEASGNLKDTFGSFGYLIGGTRQYLQQEMFSATVTIDDTSYDVSTGSITVANAAPVTSVFAQGKGEPPRPMDGMLDVTIIEGNEIGRVTLQMVINSVLSLEQIEGLRHYRGKKVKLEADPPQRVVVDGEVVGYTPITFINQPKSLKVLIAG